MSILSDILLTFLMLRFTFHIEPTFTPSWLWPILLSSLVRSYSALSSMGIVGASSSKMSQSEVSSRMSTSTVVVLEAVIFCSAFLFSIQSLGIVVGMDWYSANFSSRTQASRQAVSSLENSWSTNLQNSLLHFTDFPLPPLKLSAVSCDEGSTMLSLNLTQYGSLGSLAVLIMEQQCPLLQACPRCTATPNRTYSSSWPEGVFCRKPRSILQGYSNSVKILVARFSALLNLYLLRLKKTTFGSAPNSRILPTTTLPYQSVSILSSIIYSYSSLPSAQFRFHKVLPRWSSRWRSISLKSQAIVLTQGFQASRELRIWRPLPSHSSFNCGHSPSSSSRNPSKNSCISCCFLGSGNLPQAVSSQLASTLVKQAVSWLTSSRSMKMRLMARMMLLFPSKSRMVFLSGLRKYSICRVEFIQQVLPQFWMPRKLFSLGTSLWTVNSMASLGLKQVSNDLSSMMKEQALVSSLLLASILQVLYSTLSPKWQVSLPCTLSSWLMSISPSLSTTSSPRYCRWQMDISVRYGSLFWCRPSSVIQSIVSSWWMMHCGPSLFLLAQGMLGSSRLSIRFLRYTSETTRYSLAQKGSLESTRSSQL